MLRPNYSIRIFILCLLRPRSLIGKSAARSGQKTNNVQLDVNSSEKYKIIFPSTQLLKTWLKVETSKITVAIRSSWLYEAG